MKLCKVWYAVALLAIVNTVGGTTTTYSQTYSPTGELIDDGIRYAYRYDAWGRLTQVMPRNNLTKPVAKYKYNGLGFRIGWQYHQPGSGTTGIEDGTDPWYWLVYNDRWQQIAAYRLIDPSTGWTSDANKLPKEIITHHMAGIDGSGGSSYIDSVVARERDNTAWGVNANTTGWAIASRQYLLQNWRADVVRATDSSGTITDRIRYTAYGEPQRYSLFDVGRFGGNIPDGSFDNNDFTAFINSFGIGDASVDPAADVDHDGTIDGSDFIAFTNAFAIGDEDPLGTGQLSRELDAGFRRGYAGYEFDPVLGASSASIYHVRNRVYNAEDGRWNRRDPLGYVDGMGLYEYCRSMPSVSTDPSGLAAAVPCDRNVLSACMTLALLHGIANLSPCAGAVRFMQTAPQCACALPLILGVEGAVIARCLLALTATAVVVVTSPLVVRSYDPFARYGDEGTFRLPRIDFIAPHIEIMIREWEWAPGYPRRPSKGEKCRLSSTGGDPSGSGPRTCNYWCSRSGQTITIRIPKGDQWVTPACPQELQF